MSGVRDGLYPEEGIYRRKVLRNVTMAASVLPLQRLRNISPLLLLELNPDTPAEIVDWFLGKILEAESLGGANLLGRVVGQSRAGGAVMVIGATFERLLLEADETILFRRKPCCTNHELQPSMGDPREETPNPTHPGEVGGLCNMLSSAEAVILVQRILGQLMMGEREEVDMVSLIHGEPVIDSLHRHGIITDSYPLHDCSQLDHLRQRWRASWGGINLITQTKQELLLEEIRAYFGEGVAHYFGFLGSLINTLILRSLLSVFLFNVPLGCNGSLAFSVSNVIWSAFFLQGWKQRNESLEAVWAGPKPNHSSSGASGLREAGSQQEKGNNPEKKYYRRFLKSMFFLVFMLLLSSILIMAYIRLDSFIYSFCYKMQITSLLQVLDYLPGVLLTISMRGMDHIALQMSYNLCPKSLHEGNQSALHQPLLPELIIVRIYNHFSVHFYRGVVQGDLIALRCYVSVQLATQVALHLLNGALLHYQHRKRTRSQSQPESRAPMLNWIQEQGGRPTRDPVEIHEHLSILTAYCNVMVFSGIYPLCALWCLLGAVAQSHLDFWYMCALFRRPFPQSASGMKLTWQRVFEIAEVLAIAANAALFWRFLDVQLFLPGFSQWEVLKALLGFQLVLMGLKMVMVSVVSHAFRGCRQAGQSRLRRLRQHRPRRPQTQW